MPVPNVRGAIDAAQRATLDRAGTCLVASTAALVAAAQAAAGPGGCETHLLAYLLTVLEG